MRRRELLIGGGVGFAAAGAGCLGVVDGGSDGYGGAEDHGTAPVIADGMACYGREDGFLYGVDIVEGRERWRFDTGAAMNVSVSGAAGVVYAGNADGRLLAVEVESGAERWSIESGSGIVSDVLFTPVVSDGVVYFGTHVNGFSAIDAESGDVQWTFDPHLRPYFLSLPFSFGSAIVDGVAYFGAGGVLYAVDAETGTAVGSFEAAGSVSTPTAADGVLCIGGGEHLHALDLDGLTERWRVDLGEKVWFPRIADDAVYAPDDGGTLSAVGVDAGDVRWRFEGDGELHTPPVFTDDTVIFGSHDGNLYAADRATGRERWRYDVGEGAHFPGVAAAPTLVDDVVYFAAPGHTLVGVDAETGDEQLRIVHAE